MSQLTDLISQCDQTAATYQGAAAGIDTANSNASNVQATTAAHVAADAAAQSAADSQVTSAQTAAQAALAPLQAASQALNAYVASLSPTPNPPAAPTDPAAAS